MEEAYEEWSRRRFIRTAAGIGTTLILNPFTSWSIQEKDPRVAAIVERTMGIDTHNHIDVPFDVAQLPVKKFDLTGDFSKSGDMNHRRLNHVNS